MITKEQAEEQLAAWLAASLAVSQAQSYTIAGRSLSRANLGEIQSQIKFWQNALRSFETGSSFSIKLAKF